MDSCIELVQMKSSRPAKTECAHAAAARWKFADVLGCAKYVVFDFEGRSGYLSIEQEIQQCG